MRKIGKRYSFLFYLFLFLSLFFITKAGFTLYNQKKVVEKKSSRHIDVIERRFKYYLLNLPWEKTSKSNTTPQITENSLFLFKKEKDEYYQCEVKNYQLIFKLIFESISTNQYIYPFIIADDGRYIYHPNPSLFGKTLFSEARDDKSRELYNMAKLLIEKKPQKYIGRLQDNKMTKQKSRIEYRAFKEYQLYLGIVSVDESSYFITIKDIRKDMYLFFIALSSALLLAIKKENGIKKVIFISSIQFCILLSLIAVINYSNSKEDMGKFTPISSYNDLFKFLNKHKLSREGDIYIQVQDLDFLSNDNVRISGLIEYYKNEFERVYFPDSTDYSESILKDKNDIITKKFSFTISEDFFYYKYPLESNIISIKMTTWNDEKTTVLTPNFSRYADKLLISSKWGLAKNLSISDWNVLGTFFSYEEVENNNYNLTFNIYVKRNILAPFISNLLPFFVIIGLLLVLILLIPKDKEKLNIDFFLGSISGLFFTILISQNSLREDISTGEILYLDYFYFFLYFILIFTIILIFLYKINSLNYLIVKKFKYYFSYVVFLVLTAITFFNFPLG